MAVRQACVVAVLWFCIAVALDAQVNVTTYHNDNARTGQNMQETILTPSNVNSTQFGRLFSVAVDGWVYAQLLYLSNVSINGGTYNVLYVATEHDSLYAIDADNGTIYWQISLIPSGGTTVNSSTDLVCGDLVPEVGITGTPVIDTSTRTIYLVAKSKVSGNLVQYLHAIDVVTGAEKFNGPVAMQATVPGTASDGNGTTVSFSPHFENQRAGLLLDNGHVVIGWSSHCDINPWHGWIMSYNAANLTPQPEAAFITTADGSAGGVWMSGGGLAADSSGNIFFATGNGSWNGTTDYGDSILKLGLPNGGAFPVVDYFTPYNQNALSGGDTDVASGGVLLLPTLPSGQQLLVQMGKEGKIYVLDRNNMGKYCLNLTPPCINDDPQIVEEIPGATVGVWGSPAYWNGSVYWSGGREGGTAADNLKAFSFNVSNSGLLSTSPTSQSAKAFSFSSPTPSISSNGNTNGILWGLDNSLFGNCSTIQNCQVLYAYDATNLANMLYNSNQAPNGRDVPGSIVKFTTPTIVNGKVYVGSQYNVSVFGLFTGVLVQVSPPTTTLQESQSQTLTATVTGTSNTAVNWGMSPQVGTLTPNGLTASYTAPATITSLQTVMLTATSQADPTKVGTATVRLQPPFSPILVHSGGGGYTDSQGQVWNADEDFKGGNTASTAHAISNTSDPTLYQSERYGTFNYIFTVPNGNYTVLLKFAEIFFSLPGQRVFNVAINGAPVLSNFDIVAQAGGPFTALDEAFPVAVSNGTLTIKFTNGTANLPKVSAVAVEPGGVLVQMSPPTTTLQESQSQTLTATVTGTSNTAVNWGMSPQVGTLTPNGLTASYTAPATITSLQTVMLTATSQADPTKVGTATVRLQPPFSPILVHSGGGGYTDSQGQVWNADEDFKGGNTASTAHAISNTSDPTLYQSERYGTFNYIFTVPNGNYTVLLKFAEIFFSLPGQRVFNVAINGAPVLSNFDIVAQAGGPFTALDEAFPVTVTNGNIIIQFSKGSANLPKVSAIAIH
jgi:hypothetical protein